MNYSNTGLRIASLSLISFLLACGATPNAQTPSNKTDLQTFEATGTLQGGLQLQAVTQTLGQFDPSKMTFGHTPDAALVPLVFDDVGHLVTAAEYNAQKFSTALETKFTDLATYKTTIATLVKSGSQSVDRINNAQVKYVMDLAGLVPGRTDLPVYAFDPYRSKYFTLEETKALVNSIKVVPRDPIAPGKLGAKVTTSSSIWIGDIATTDADASGWINHGHDGTVTQIANSSNQILSSLRGSGYSHSSNTRTMEATGPTWWGNVPFEVSENELTRAFFASGKTTYLSYKPGLSDNQLIVIRDFTRQQDWGTYSVFTDKWSIGWWYCSKLVWRAYIQAGVNVGDWSGFWVLPFTDILPDSDLSKYYQVTN
jgi:hypothetical protein